MNEDVIATGGQSLVDAARDLRDSGVLSRSLHGNMSLMTSGDRGSFLMTGSSLKNLAVADLGHVSVDGELLGGGMRATEVEVIAMHAVVYGARADVQCVIHTHSPAATAFAVARKPLDCVAESLARWGFKDETPVASYGPRGSAESVAAITEVLEANREAPAILLASHGVLVFGATVNEAVRRAIAIEEAAELALRAEAIGGAKVLTEAEALAAMGRRYEFAKAEESGAKH